MNKGKDIINVLVIAFVLLRLVEYFFVIETLRMISAVLLIIVLFVSFPRVDNKLKIVLGAMLLISSVLHILYGADLSEWKQSLLQNSNLVVLLICVPMISAPFYYEDYQGELKKLSQIKMRNVLGFLGLVTLSTYGIAIVVSVGAVLIIYKLLQPFAALYNAEHQFLKTLSRSYFSSGFWSPAWATVLIFTVHPQISWVRLIPVAIAFGVLFNVMNLATVYFEVKRFPKRFEVKKPEPGLQYDKKKLVVMLFLLIIMILSIIVVNVTTGWDLMLVVPIVSLLFPIVVALVQRRTVQYRRLIKDYYDVSLVKVREQVALFTIAGFFGRALDITGVGQLLIDILPDWFRGFPPLMIAAIILIIAIPGLLGIHPSAIGIAMVTMLTPNMVGLSDYSFAFALLSGWIIGLMNAPFCVTAVMLSSVNGKSTFANSVLLNWKFSLVCIVVFSLLISVVGPLMG